MSTYICVEECLLLYVVPTILCAAVAVAHGLLLGSDAKNEDSGSHPTAQTHGVFVDPRESATTGYTFCVRPQARKSAQMRREAARRPDVTEKGEGRKEGREGREGKRVIKTKQKTKTRIRQQ